MSKPAGYNEYRNEDVFFGFLESIARFLLWAGLLAVVASTGFLVYTFITFGAGASGASVAQAESNIAIFSKVLFVGLAALAVGTSFLFWGEETLGVLQLVFAALLYFAPLFLPTFLTNGQVATEVAGKALAALQMGGLLFGGFAVTVLTIDLALRARNRVRQGSKADQLKYGKGVKEERDIQNVFMGKCWQLPFCRKFVRERCPIYHSQRTCWKERVGCMCEEEVIRNAMENKPIPKDQVAATRYIPVNNRLSEEQKKERCRQCVIYNEHQKHKYKLMLPITILLFVGGYILFREPLLSATGVLIDRLDSVIASATYRDGTGIDNNLKTGLFRELLLVAFIVVTFAYAMRMLEYMVFRLKI